MKKQISFFFLEDGTQQSRCSHTATHFAAVLEKEREREIVYFVVMAHTHTVCFFQKKINGARANTRQTQLSSVSCVCLLVWEHAVSSKELSFFFVFVYVAILSKNEKAKKKREETVGENCCSLSIYGINWGSMCSILDVECKSQQQISLSVRVRLFCIMITLTNNKTHFQSTVGIVLFASFAAVDGLIISFSFSFFFVFIPQCHR